MTTPLANLVELVQLAGERSSDRRRELLRRVTDVFVDAPQTFDSRQTAQISDIISVLAREMETEVRQALAVRIATLPEAPRDLLLEFANDDISVARPILTDSLTLTDFDLIALSKLVSQEHLEAIARRGKISAPVTDQLTIRGDDRVLAELASNPGADLSRASFEIMIARAGATDALHQPLVLRSDIPTDLLNGMFFIVSASLKRLIVERTDNLDPAIVDEAVRESERRLRQRTMTPDKQQADVDAFVARLAKSGPINEALLCALAKQDRLLELAMVLAKLSALNFATAKRILSDCDPVGLAVVARACRFDRQTFATLALRQGAGSRSPEEAADLIQLYDKVPANAAQRVIRFWRVRQVAVDQAAA